MGASVLIIEGWYQSALSQHLKILRDAGIVGTRRDSQTIVYRLIDEDAVKILAALRTIKFH